MHSLISAQIPKVASSHHGAYSCNVEYSIQSLTERELIQQTTTVFINSASYQGTRRLLEDYLCHTENYYVLVNLQIRQGWTQEKGD